MKKLFVLLFSSSFLMFSSLLNCSKVNSIEPSSSDDNYKIINAVTGEELPLVSYINNIDTLKTNFAATSEMKEILAENGYDISSINISLYHAFLAVNADLPQKKWNSTQDEQTISSPWLKLTKTTSSSGATEITIHVDATYSRYIMDLFPTKNKGTITVFGGNTKLQNHHLVQRLS